MNSVPQPTCKEIESYLKCDLDSCLLCNFVQIAQCKRVHMMILERELNKMRKGEVYDDL